MQTFTQQETSTEIIDAVNVSIDAISSTADRLGKMLSKADLGTQNKGYVEVGQGVFMNEAGSSTNTEIIVGGLVFREENSPSGILKSSLSVAGIVAVADDPLPIGDMIGVVILAGGVAWAGYETLSSSTPSQITSHSIKDSSKNKKHGDGGRELGKVDKEIENLKAQLKGATVKEKKKIKQKIKNKKQNAQKNKKGEEHSIKNKR